MTDDANPILPNGKLILNNALPGDQGGNVLTLRESHRYSKHLAYLAEHMQELKEAHNVGTLGIEMCPYMMAFHWAYRDAEPGKQKDKARDVLIDAYAEYYLDYPNLAERQANAVLAAVDQGIDVTCFDSRGTFEEDRNEAYGKMATKIYRAHPEYKAKLDTIERAAGDMARQDVPMEVIYATILSRSADPAKNMIAIAGYNHINGTHFRQDENYRCDGIFDEGLANAPAAEGTPWRVTDGFMGTRASIRYMAHVRSPSSSSEKNTQDRIDFIWSMPTDEVALRHTEGDNSQVLSNSDELQGLMPKFDPTANAETAEKLFRGKLDPSKIAELQQTIADLQVAFTKPAIPAISQPAESTFIGR